MGRVVTPPAPTTFYRYIGFWIDIKDVVNGFPPPQIFASCDICPKLLLLFLFMKQGLLLQVFPRLTKCTFYNYGSSGTIQAHDALCVLALNIINEKVKPFSNVVFTSVVFTVIKFYFSRVF